ncbi:putative WUSCHEL-related homeobox 5-like [Capsicum annuum]|nr:putative WUSCHEL-related homeobox 5-like [Capsicum annuum]
MLEWVKVSHWLGNGLVVCLYGLGKSSPLELAFEVELGPRSISLTIHHDKLFDLLARVGALNREVSTIVHDLEEKSRNEESIDETCGVNLDLLEEKKELVKEDLGHDDIRLVKEALEFIRSFFVNVEQGLNKHLWARVLDVAYEIKLINEEDSNISEKIPKNRSLTVVNSTKKTVESKSLTAGKIIVGFEEETNWLISKLTSGLKYLDVISITDTGSDLKFSEDIDIADMLRKQLFGKRRKLGVITERAFGEQSCPDELLDVGKEIVQNWKGLPLVVDLIAEVIARKEKTKSVWLEVRNNLNSFILNSEVDVIKVVELSYDHLPHHVKPCFLYLASYPKESEVVRDELKMYLHAEGLVERTEMKSEEEVMDNLISSSLVALPYKSDIPWAIWNLPLTRRGWPQPKCAARGHRDVDPSRCPTGWDLELQHDVPQLRQATGI